MWRFGAVAVVVVFVVVIENVQGGRTLKKYSESGKRPGLNEMTTDEDGNILETQVQPEELSVKEIVGTAGAGTVSENGYRCSENGTCKRRRKIANSTATTVMTAPPPTAAAATSYQQQQLPQTQYELNWRNRLRTSNPVQSSSQRLLVKLQRASLDMAKGILQGLGWDIQGWEMVLLESIVKTVSKDLVYMLQHFF